MCCSHNIMTQEYGKIQVWKELVSSVTPIRGNRDSRTVRHSSFAPSSVGGTPTTIVKSGNTSTVSCSSAHTVLWLPFNIDSRVESVDENTPGTGVMAFSSARSMDIRGGASGAFGGWVCDIRAAREPSVSVMSRSQSERPVTRYLGTPLQSKPVLTCGNNNLYIYK